MPAKVFKTMLWKWIYCGMDLLWYEQWDVNIGPVESIWQSIIIGSVNCMDPNRWRTIIENYDEWSHPVHVNTCHLWVDSM